MTPFENLTDANFLIYATKLYDSPNCIMSELEEDLKRLKYVKRLVKKYHATGDLKERLILNHIIVLANVFSVQGAVRMLFYKMDQADYSLLKTFLLFLHYMPDRVRGINGVDIITSSILVDMNAASKLRTIPKHAAEI